MQDRADLILERPQKAVAVYPSKSKASSLLVRTAQPLSNAFQCSKLQALFQAAAQVHQRHDIQEGDLFNTALSSLTCPLDAWSAGWAPTLTDSAAICLTSSLTGVFVPISFMTSVSACSEWFRWYYSASHSLLVRLHFMMLHFRMSNPCKSSAHSQAPTSSKIGFSA